MNAVANNVTLLITRFLKHSLMQSFIVDPTSPHRHHQHNEEVFGVHLCRQHFQYTGLPMLICKWWLNLLFITFSSILKIIL